MSGRMLEVQSGCYYQYGCPCCNAFYFKFGDERSHIDITCCLLGGCFSCPCGGRLEEIGEGSATYGSAYGTDRWQTPTSFLRFGPGFPANGQRFTKC